ncbi:MAG: hypothetical protein R2788_01640 [Saprospiraceae bacterium]
MENTNLILFFFLFFILSCNNGEKIDGKCFLDYSIEKENTDLLFYVSAKAGNGCAYNIGSSYLDNEINRKMLYDGQKMYLKLSNTQDKYQLVFTIHDKKGTNREIRIKHRNWSEGRGFDYVIKNYEVEIIYNEIHENEQFGLIKICKLISAFADIGDMDGILVFSSNRGFIGSYCSDPAKPNFIINKKGDILEQFIDYSTFSFREIK